MKRLMLHRLSAFLLTIGVLSACKDEARVLVVTMGAPMATTAEASPDLDVDYTVGDTPRERELMGGLTRPQYFDRTRVLWEDRTVLDSGPGIVTISLDRGGLVDYVGIQDTSTYAKDSGPDLARQLRDPPVALGWRDEDGRIPEEPVITATEWGDCFAGKFSAAEPPDPGRASIGLSSLYMGKGPSRLRYGAGISCRLPPRKGMQLRAHQTVVLAPLGR